MTTLTAPQLRAIIAQGNGESQPGQTVRALARRGLVEWHERGTIWPPMKRPGHWILTRAGEEVVTRSAETQ